MNEKNRLINEDVLKKEISEIYRNTFEVIGFYDDGYPQLLKQTAEAPIVLMVRGDKNIFIRDCFAIVGSRELDRNDKDIIEEAVQGVQTIDGVVVSGLAKGSDIVAHIKSMKSGTIAVMPCGLNNCYPQEHDFFVEKIVDLGGVVVSEFAINEPPRQVNFIKRNRIITGLSYATFIARSRSIRSGTMSSANFAKKQGRKVYTYDFDGENGGNKYLLSNGLAEDVGNFDSFSLSLLGDIAEIEAKLLEHQEEAESGVADKIKSNRFLFNDYCDAENLESVKREVLNIARCNNIKVCESNADEVLKKCHEILQIDKKTILKAVLEIVL